VGGTQYMRPLPGEARMYPETDIPPVIMTHERVEQCRSTLPEPIEAKVERIAGMSGISLHDLWKIEEFLDSFIYGIEESRLEPAVVYNVLGSNAVDFRRRQGVTFAAAALNQLLDLIARTFRRSSTGWSRASHSKRSPTAWPWNRSTWRPLSRP